MELNYIIVENQSMLETMCRDFYDFHDAFVKEASYFTDANVDMAGNWYGYGYPYDARLLFLSQSPQVRCLELVFIGVEKSVMSFNCDLSPSGKVDNDKTTFFLGKEPHATDFVIIAKRLKYRMYSPTDSLGQIKKNADSLRIYDNVLFIDDETVLYSSYDSREVKIRMTKHDDCVIMDSDTIQSWLPPHQDDVITNSKKTEIQNNISEFFDRNGVIHGWI